jgi:hypothetical protein
MSKMRPDLFQMGEYSAKLGDFCSGFIWVSGEFGPKEKEIDFSSLPDEDGKIVCRLEDSQSIIYDLAWGGYSEVGSIRATFEFFK